MLPRDLILVRHGEPDCEPHIFLGSTDPSLDDYGREQIESCARAVHQRWPRAGFLYSSALRRAQESADIFSQHCGLTVTSDRRLNEVFFGDWEGRSFAEVEKSYPGAVDKWYQDPVHNPGPGGESFCDLAVRIDDFLCALRRQDHRGEPCILVAHFCSIAVLVSRVLGVPLACADRFALGRGQYAHIHNGCIRSWGLPVLSTVSTHEPER